MSAAADGEYQPHVVLVTGGAGFIASNLVVHLVNTYPAYKIIVVDKLDYCSTIANLAPVLSRPNFKFIRADITTPGLILSVLKHESVDTILHFAAQTHVDCSFANSQVFTHHNVVGTHMMLEACRAASLQVRRFVHVSTDEVYGENTPGQPEHCFRESDALHPTNPYSASKASAEMFVEAYIKSYRLPIIITRGNNVYGPRQYPEKVIPKFLSLAMRGRPLPVHGAGLQRRSFMFVSDAVAAFDVIVHRGQVGEVYNVGSSAERTALDIAHDICNLFGMDPQQFILHVTDRDFNDQRYFVDAAKLQALGWTERVSFTSGLAMTAQWYRDHADYWPEVETALLPHPGQARARSLTDPKWCGLPVAVIKSAQRLCHSLVLACQQQAVEHRVLPEILHHIEGAGLYSLSRTPADSGESRAATAEGDGGDRGAEGTEDGPAATAAPAAATATAAGSHGQQAHLYTESGAEGSRPPPPAETRACHVAASSSPSPSSSSTTRAGCADGQAGPDACSAGAQPQSPVSGLSRCHVVWIVPQPTLSDAVLFMNEASTLMQLCRKRSSRMCAVLPPVRGLIDDTQAVLDALLAVSRDSLFVHCSLEQPGHADDAAVAVLECLLAGTTGAVYV